MSVLAKTANQAVFKANSSSEGDGSNGEDDGETVADEGEDIEEVEMNNGLGGDDDSGSASIFSFVETISSWQRAMAPQQ